jgi:transposase
MAIKGKDDIVETKIQITVAARDAMNRLSASKKRKGALVSDLLLAAEQRYEDYQNGTAPIDDFTRAIIRAEVLRQERLRKSGEQDEDEGDE